MTKITAIEAQAVIDTVANRPRFSEREVRLIKNHRYIDRPVVDLTCELADEVSEATGIPISAIFSRRRDRATAHARQVVMWKAHNLGFSFPEIGRAFKRHHTTVLHAYQTIQKIMDEEKQ